MLELRQMVTVLHLVACPFIFVLFDGPKWQGGVAELMKNDHILVLSGVWVLFPKFLGRLGRSLCYSYIK